MLGRVRHGVAGMAMGLLLGSHAARAQDPLTVTVVEIAPGAQELDPDKLRAQVGSELHTRAVPPDDAEAASAKGTLRIDLDHGTRTLSVTYLARSVPVTREVPLPADAASARSAAALLAGNLARDEAGELTAELRAQRPTPPPPQAAAPVSPPVDRAAAARRQAQLDDARMQATLDFYARADHRNRMVWGWTLLAADAIGSAATLSIERPVSPNAVLVPFANPFFIYGMVELLTKSRFEALAAFGSTENDWVLSAWSERRRRTGLGIVLIAAGGLALGGAVIAVADRDWQIDADTRALYGGAFSVLGVLLAGGGVYAVASDGPVESALEAYERGSGRYYGTWRAAASGGGLHVAFVPGGAAASFGGSF
jgi:hypothetical protein